MSDSIKNKAVKGIGWSIVDNISGSGITFIVGIILARILSPAEFGVIGILTILIAVSNSIVDSGFSNALIRKKNANEIDYNTVFYVNVVLGGVMYLILFFSSPAIARFFELPILVPTLRVISLILIFNALAIIQKTKLVKAIDFKTQAKVSIIASLVSAAVGIGMALCGYGVWALVGQQLSRQFCNTLFLWLFNRWLPQWIYSWNSFKELFSFGFKLLLSGLTYTIYQNVYQFVIGKFYTKETLGQYTRALQFQQIFTSNLTAVIQRVTYPTLSHIQDDDDRLREAYRKMIRYCTIASFSGLLFLAAVAKPLIIIFVGKKWLPAVFYLQVLCFLGIPHPLYVLNTNILQVKGRSGLILKLDLFKQLVATVPLVIGILTNITTLLIGSVIVIWISLAINSYYAGKTINYSMFSQLGDIAKPLLFSFIAASVVWLLTLTTLPWIEMLILQILLGSFLLFVLYYFCDRKTLADFRKIVVDLRNSRSNHK